MRVTVKLFANFRNGRFDIEEKEYPGESSVLSIVHALQIPPEEIGIILLNGRHAELKEAPSAGDTLSIFPLLGGG